jgi:hypothetical protein
MLVLGLMAGCKKKPGVDVRVGKLPDATYKVRVRCTANSAIGHPQLVLKGYVNNRSAFQFTFDHDNKTRWSKWIDVSGLVGEGTNVLLVKGNHGLAEVEYQLTRDGSIVSSGIVGNDTARSLGVTGSGVEIRF